MPQSPSPDPPKAALHLHSPILHCISSSSIVSHFVGTALVEKIIQIHSLKTNRDRRAIQLRLVGGVLRIHLTYIHVDTCKSQLYGSTTVVMATYGLH